MGRLLQPGNGRRLCGYPCGTGQRGHGDYYRSEICARRRSDRTCREAIRQIEHTGYDEDLEDDGVEYILKYGIAWYKKRCKVMCSGI